MTLWYNAGMNEASIWRRDLARRIAPVYADNPKVAAVILGGSSARGCADRFSDIEIGVFWHEPPTDEERLAAVERAGGDLIRLYPYDPAEEVWEDDYMMGRAAPDALQSGVLLEVPHYTVEFTGRVLREVLEEYDTSDSKQNLIAGVHGGVALYGGDLIARWQAQTAHYPDGLALAMVRAHAQIDHLWRVEMLLARGNNLPMLYWMYSNIAQKLLRVLIALNRVYYIGFKWLDRQAEGMRIAPPDFAGRIKAVFSDPPAEGGRLLAELAEETYNLVEAEMPEIDVDRLRRILRYKRPPWDRMPPGALR